MVSTSQNSLAVSRRKHRITEADEEERSLQKLNLLFAKAAPRAAKANAAALNRLRRDIAAEIQRLH